MKPSAVGFPGRRAHWHCRPAPDERLIGEGLALRPLFDALSRLLGQLAGVLLLACAGIEPDRQASHLAMVKEQLQAAHACFAGLARPRHLGATFHAMGQTLALLDDVTARLERHPAAVLPGDGAFGTLMEELSAARRLLLAGSTPALGIGLVDFAGACCARGD